MHSLHTVFIGILIILSVTACGGGGGGSDAELTNTITLSGSVGDGPIISANVTVKDSANNVITTTTSDASANYSIDTTAGNNIHPLTVTASGGTDLVTNAPADFVMYSVALTPAATSVNINPYTTLIYKIAEQNGGINQANIDSAKTTVLNNLNLGLNTNLVSDPISTPVNDVNIAYIVKASETLGEMIRRTRDLVNAAGNSMNADAIVNTIAADMTDGKLDGNGASGSSPQIAALANISAAYVAIEAINNRLMVNGTDATQAMDRAISISDPASTTSTADVAINARLLAMANDIVSAVNEINPDTAVTDLKTQLQNITADTLPASIATLDTTVLNNTQSILGSASADMLTRFNSSASGTSSNTAPTISGSPATSVTVNRAYSFTPSASDIDNDTLTYSITNMPAWASFDTTTGALTGTPTTVASFTDITISVSDGTESVSLPAFFISVSETPNTAPTISGSPATSVTVNTAYSFTPTASDADNDTLTYSITNMPVWANFDTTTGALTGTPTAVSSFVDITISVSDGTDSVSLAAFNITVKAVASTGNAILSWTAPATRTDSSNLPLSEISGYRIYRGSSASSLTMIADVNDGTATSYTANNLATGTHYFAITVYDSSNKESAYSTIESKTIE